MQQEQHDAPPGTGGVRRVHVSWFHLDHIKTRGLGKLDILHDTSECLEKNINKFVGFRGFIKKKIL